MVSVDALIFDLDGTLVDSRRDIAESVQFLQKKLRVRVSPESEIAAFVGDGMRRLIERALPKWPHADLPRVIGIFIRHYQAHCLEHTRAYPGVAEMLDHFRAKKLAVVTNKPWRVSCQILEGLGLSSRFRVVVGGDSLRSKKPDAGPVSFALRALQVTSPQRAVMIGDGINDILSGHAAGAKTCGIPSNIGNSHQLLKARPDFMVLNAYELMHLFS